MQGIKGMQELRMKPGRLSHHGETEETRSLSEASVLSCVSYENTFSAVISSPYLHLLAGLDRRKRIFIRYGEPQAHGNSVVKTERRYRPVFPSGFLRIPRIPWIPLIP